ncbi:hypothetical protein DRW41_16195 [Neobacillus piezotolerans]|uniref:Uncharacterized protein n=1 Tax=Neobacillus piezotolerans TaxID=2259171 RepID=A0A3D8GMH3_9BACI|nr:hypothetical protein [Neobacillus piezotolerans]RDU35685.1 hypothetical protein DRW41_16195 [Neobacillus piezotolerans]
MGEKELLVQILEAVNEIQTEQKELDNKVSRIEKTVNSHTDILNSFKFDVDFLVKKQAKNEMRINRIEKMHYL